MEASGHRGGHAYAAIRSGMLTLAATEKDMLLIMTEYGMNAGENPENQKTWKS
jgi:hypothetical protein